MLDLNNFTKTLHKPKNYIHISRSDARMMALKVDLHAECLKVLHTHIKRLEDLKKQEEAFLKVADAVVDYVYGQEAETESKSSTEA